jgi:hypothetical protein
MLGDAEKSELQKARSGATWEEMLNWISDYHDSLPSQKKSEPKLAQLVIEDGSRFWASSRIATLT